MCLAITLAALLSLWGGFRSFQGYCITFKIFCVTWFCFSKAITCEHPFHLKSIKIENRLVFTYGFCRKFLYCHCQHNLSNFETFHQYASPIKLSKHWHVPFPLCYWSQTVKKHSEAVCFVYLYVFPMFHWLMTIYNTLFCFQK